MQKIDRKEFVQGVAALSVSEAVGISFGKEGNNMKKTGSSCMTVGIRSRHNLI